MATLEVQNFIDGHFLKCERHLDSYNPSTGQVWARIPDSGEAEVNAAVTAANHAFKGYVLFFINIELHINQVSVFIWSEVVYTSCGLTILLPSFRGQLSVNVNF